MKNTRKLIPALAMLLVSAVMMSTASFAWFTMNSEVKATGMQVTATAPASLWISQTDGGWASSITLENINDDMPDYFVPSTINENAAYDGWTFKQLSSEASILVLNDGTIPTADGVDVTTGITEENEVMVGGNILVDDEDEPIPAYVASTSYYTDTFKIKLDAHAGSTSKVYVNASVRFNGDLGERASADDIYKALRVAIVVDNGTPVVLEPTALGDAANIVLAALATGTTNNELVTLTGGATATDVAVYAWFEGSDSDCKNANALYKDEFAIDLYFSVDDDDKLTRD